MTGKLAEDIIQGSAELNSLYLKIRPGVRALAPPVVATAPSPPSRAYQIKLVNICAISWNRIRSDQYFRLSWIRIRTDQYSDPDPVGSIF